MADEVVGETTTPTGGEPLLLVARQGRAHIRILSENRGEETLRRVQVPLHGIDLRGPEGGPLSHAFLVGAVKPGQIARVSLSLEVHPQAPPGVYHGTLQLGGQERPLTLLIPEERRVRIEPNRFEVDVAPGAALEHVAAIENLGNVPIPIRDPEPAALSPAEQWVGAVRRAAEEAPSEDYEDFLNSLVARARETLQGDRTRRIQVTVKDAPLELAPGKTALLTLRWQVPQELEHGQRYGADVVVAGTSVFLRIHHPRDGGPPEAERPSARPRPRRRG